MREKSSTRRLTTTAPRVPPGDADRVPVTKVANEVYASGGYKKFRDVVLSRAAYRCETVTDGTRCERSFPKYQLYADHITELSDGGSEYDPANGQCLCAKHHTIKTLAERTKRIAAGVRHG